MTTYDTKIPLDLAHLPKIDQDAYNDDGDLYDELLDIHNAIEQLASNHDDCCFNVEESVPYCVDWVVSPDLQNQTQEVLLSVDSNGAYIEGVVGQLKNDSLLAVKDNYIYWVKQVAGTLAAPEEMKNELRYSSNFGESWTTAARGYDLWTASVWGDYTQKSYYNNTTIRNMVAASTGIYYSAQHSDAYNNIMYKVGYGLGSQVSDHQPLYSSFSFTGQGQTWTGQGWKVGGQKYHNIDVGGNMLVAGGIYAGIDGMVAIYLDGAPADSRPTTPNDWTPAGDSETGVLEDGATLAGNDLPRTSFFQDRSGAPSAETIDCYNIKNLGYRTYVSDGTNKIWYYDREAVEFSRDGNYKERSYSEWSDNSNQFIPYDTTYGWLYLKDSEPGIVSDRNAVQVSTSATTWGWFTLTRGGYSSSLVYPKSGVEGQGSNKGKFTQLNADIDQDGFDYAEWFLSNQGKPADEREPLPDQLWRSYFYSGQEVDLSSLLVPLDPQETTLEVCRVWTDVNYAGERFVLIYAFANTTTSDGWPLRFYIRAAGSFNVDSFSEPAIIQNPDIATVSWPAAMLAARQAGGYRVLYSASESKFVVASIYLTAPGTYKEVVAVFDDPFVCALEGATPGTGGKEDGNYFYYDEPSDSFVGIPPDEMGFIPDGGTTGQQLVKASNANKDATWVDRDAKVFMQSEEPTNWNIGDFWISEGYD